MKKLLITVIAVPALLVMSFPPLDDELSKEEPNKIKDVLITAEKKSMEAIKNN